MNNNTATYIIKKNIFLIIFSNLLLMIASAGDIAIAFILGGMIDASLNLNMEMFLKDSLTMVIVLLVRGVFRNLGMNLQSYFTKRANFEYKNSLASGVLRRDFKEFGRHGLAYYLNILIDESKEISSHYFYQLIFITGDIIKILFAILALIYVSWKYMVAVFFIFILAAVLPSLMGKKLGKKKIIATEKNEQFIVGVKGLLEGFEIIRTYGLQKILADQFAKQNNNFELAKYSFEITDNFKDSLAEFLATLSQIGSIAIGVFFIFSGDMTIPMLITGIQIIGNIMNPVSSLSQRIALMISAKPLLKKHKELIADASGKTDGGEKLDKIDNIYVNNLSFAYEDNVLMDDISYCFEHGKKYAIIGESGSGKSTFLRLLLGYFDNYRGSITYSNTDLKTVDYDDLYKHIAVMHQNVFLFEDTVENNIKLFRDIGQEAYENAVAKSNIGSVVERLTKENSTVKDNGVNLSGGEKQRISIARSIISSPGVLFTDEATAALDIDNARMFYRIISEFKDTTCIAITHERDREILSCFDEILLLKNGKLKKVTVDEATA